MKHKTFYTAVVAGDGDELHETVCSMIPLANCGFQLVGSVNFFTSGKVITVLLGSPSDIDKYLHIPADELP